MKSITPQDYQNASTELKHQRSIMSDELRVVKRQKRTLAQDIDENKPSYATISEAYSSAIASKVMASTNMKSDMGLDEKTGKITKKQFDKKGFKERVMGWYSATKEDLDGSGKQSYCVISGWQEARNVSAAHLVPKSLSSSELLYLFDVHDGEMLGDSRNGLPLHTKLEKALDNGKIVFIPIELLSGERIARYKLILTDKSILNKEVLGPQPFGKPGVKWAEIDGQELQFPNANGPGQRYLFFRFVMTLFYCKEEGLGLDWLKDIGTKTKNMLWCTPGPYLRQSMLKVMAMECGLGLGSMSNDILSNTFTDPSELSPAEEKKNATALRVNVKDLFLGDEKDPEGAPTGLTR